MAQQRVKLDFDGENLTIPPGLNDLREKKIRADGYVLGLRSAALLADSQGGGWVDSASLRFAADDIEARTKAATADPAPVSRRTETTEG